MTRRILLSGLALALAAPAIQAAELQVTGLGWFANRRMLRDLKEYLPEAEKSNLNTDQIDELAFMVLSQLSGEGYLRPHLRITARSKEGRLTEVDYDQGFESFPPAGVNAVSVELKITPGPQYSLGRVAIRGLHSIPVEDARSLFFPQGLFAGKAVYSEDRARGVAEQLKEQLRNLGRGEARVDISTLDLDHEKGLANLELTVIEGPLWRVKGVEVTCDGPALPVPAEITALAGADWKPAQRQHIIDVLRRLYLKNGYVDVAVTLGNRLQEPAGDSREVLLEAKIRPGSQVTLSGVRFEGAVRTSQSYLASKAGVAPGAPADGVLLDETRSRLLRLGIFNSASLDLSPDDSATREAVFTVHERNPLDASLLLGYGSYEKLRGGVEVDRNNLFGLAHQARLLVVQSMKSSRIDLRYSIPEVLTRNTRLSLEGELLQREEFAFNRDERTIDLTLMNTNRVTGYFSSAAFGLEDLRTDENTLATRETDDTKSRFANLIFKFGRDKTGHSLMPRKGFRWYTESELSLPDLFNSDANFQRFVGGTAWHKPIFKNQWLHLKVELGDIENWNGSPEDVPAGKRFFPGGENSIRGYTDGEASPRAPNGDPIGADFYSLTSLEWECRLRGSLTFLVFADGLLETARYSSYNTEEQLFSVGLGLRLDTPLGPLRLEYGHNLNERYWAPSGTLHLTIGAPF